MESYFCKCMKGKIIFLSNHHFRNGRIMFTWACLNQSFPCVMCNVYNVWTMEWEKLETAWFGRCLHIIRKWTIDLYFYVASNLDYLDVICLRSMQLLLSFSFPLFLSLTSPPPDVITNVYWQHRKVLKHTLVGSCWKYAATNSAGSFMNDGVVKYTYSFVSVHMTW